MTKAIARPPGGHYALTELSRSWNVSLFVLDQCAAAGLLPREPVGRLLLVSPETRAEWERRLRGRTVQAEIQAAER
jgi:hypothetical protein